MTKLIEIKKLGTERELNKIDDDVYYVCCFDIESYVEIETCKKLELRSLL